MFESLAALIPERESAVERAMQSLIDQILASEQAEAAADVEGAKVAEQIGAAEEETAAAQAEATEHAAVAMAARLAAFGQAVADGAAHLAQVRAAQADIGRQQARQAKAIAAFCCSRPASLDRPDGEIGAAAAAGRAARPSTLAAVSEWAVDEIAVTLSLTESATTRLVVDALKLVDRLPATLDALERGELSWAHARVLTELIAPLRDEVRAGAESRLLARLGSKTPTQLRAAAHRVVARLDAEAITERVAEAIRERKIAVYSTGDGMGSLSLTGLPLPALRAIESALEQYADALAADGDTRTRAQRMVDCLIDLILRPGEHGLAPVQAQLTIIATLATLRGDDDEPGEVNGDLIPAAMVRTLAQTLGLMPADTATAPSPAATTAAAPAGDTTTTENTTTTEDAGEDHAADVGADGRAAHDATDRAKRDSASDERSSCDSASDDSASGRTGPRTVRDERAAGLADLLGVRNLAGTALAHRPEIALADELTGQLLALTDAAALRTGRPLGPPLPTEAYKPTAGLTRFVALRDRRCRFPGCRKRPVRCDLHHPVRWPLGATAHENLCCLCRHHHRLIHQAPGWSLRGLDDGGLEWTTPTGQVLITHPPRFGADDDLPPPDGPPDDTAPAEPDPPPDDPPPF